MTLNEAIWETVLILPPPQPWGVVGRGGGGFSCPLLLGKCWGRAEELRGWCWDCVPSPSPPPSAILYLQFGTLGSISAGNTDDRLDDRWQLAIRYSC